MGTLQMGASTLGWLREWAEPSNAVKRLGKRQAGCCFRNLMGLCSAAGLEVMKPEYLSPFTSQELGSPWRILWQMRLC